MEAARLLCVGALTQDTIYRLDTVVMLAIVFLDEAPDPEAAEAMIARARALAAEL